MTDSITIPLWVFLILLIITIWAVLDLVFIPSVRWFLRRRINLVLKEIGSRLDIEIRPFQGWDKAISIAFNMARLRHMVKEADGKFQADPDSLDILHYYANSISQWMVQSEPIRGLR